MTSHFPIDETEAMIKINVNFFLSRMLFFLELAMILEVMGQEYSWIIAYFKREPRGHISIYGMPIFSHKSFMPILLNHNNSSIWHYYHYYPHLAEDGAERDSTSCPMLHE